MCVSSGDHAGGCGETETRQRRDRDETRERERVCVCMYEGEGVCDCREKSRPQQHPRINSSTTLWLTERVHPVLVVLKEKQLVTLMVNGSKTQMWRARRVVCLQRFQLTADQTFAFPTSQRESGRERGRDTHTHTLSLSEKKKTPKAHT